MGGICEYKVDAFYIMEGVTVAIGIIWLILLSKSVLKIQAMKKSVWKVKFN